MMRKAALFLIVSLMVSVGLAGCGNDPDALFKEGKYAEAYTEYVRRGGIAETSLKSEKVNSTNVRDRQASGNTAIYCYSGAAECQKMLGNTAEANLYYTKVVDLSKYQIRTPHDPAVTLKDSYEKMMFAVRTYRFQQKDYISQATQSNTDPYSGGSNNTDPYSGGSNNTDPYNSRSPSTIAKSANTAQSSSLGDGAIRAAYNALQERRREFESLLNSTTTGQIANISSVKDEYKYFSSSLDSYLTNAGPDRTYYDPLSIEESSVIYYDRVTSSANRLGPVVGAARGTITYTSVPLTLTGTNPQLVSKAAAAISASAPSETTARAPVKPRQAVALSADAVAAPVTGDIKTADASMKAAFDVYKNLCSTGADATQVSKALTAYNEAKANFNALKNQQR